MFVNIMDVLIIGGGISGLTVADAILRRMPHARLAILEKESRLALHQSGRMGGVIPGHGSVHSPDHAACLERGRKLLQGFCREEGIRAERKGGGELLLAEAEDDVPRLREIWDDAGREEGDLIWLEGASLKEAEAGVSAAAALLDPGVAVTDFLQVCDRLARRVHGFGGRFIGNTQVEAVERRTHGMLVRTSRGEFGAEVVVNCTGVQIDRVSAPRVEALPFRMVPLRWDLGELDADGRTLVQHRIRVLPEPERPVSPLEITPGVDGVVRVHHYGGLAPGRESYGRWAIDWREAGELMQRTELKKLAGLHWEAELSALRRSVQPKALFERIQRILPDLEYYQFESLEAGIFAWPVMRSGALLDRPVVVEHGSFVDVCPLPTGGATMAFAVAERVRDLVLDGLLDEAPEKRRRAAG